MHAATCNATYNVRSPTVCEQGIDGCSDTGAETLAEVRVKWEIFTKAAHLWIRIKVAQSYSTI